MPTVTLEISNDLEQKLRHRAASRGLDIAKVVLEIINEELYDSGTAINPSDLPYEEWRQQFEEWINGVPQINTGFVDDSRETIYEGR